MSSEEFITVSSEIDKKIIIPGRRGVVPDLNWTCVIDVELENSNLCKKYKSGRLEITIGDGCTLYDRLIERCLQTMYVEEKSLFVLKLIKETTELRIVITLKSFEEKPLIFEWSDDEKLQLAKRHKTKGTELFKENKVEEAFYKFSLALKLVIGTDAVLEYDDPPEEVRDLRVNLYNNLAICQMHFCNYDYVIELCDKSLKVMNSIKALFRRSLAYIEKKEYEKAENDLKELLKIEPNNKAALEKYKLVRELDRPNRENYKAVVKKMFS